jgi:hypothetical protein
MPGAKAPQQFLSGTMTMKGVLRVRIGKGKRSLKTKKERYEPLSKLTGRRQTEGETTLKNPEQSE